jgi:hypothetical protein
MITKSNFEARAYNAVLYRQACQDHWARLEQLVGDAAWNNMTIPGMRELWQAHRDKYEELVARPLPKYPMFSDDKVNGVLAWLWC